MTDATRRDPLARAVLWDLDGTLVDSEEHHWQAWREVLRSEGVALTRAQFRGSFGQRNDLILRTWLGPSTPDERVRRIGEAKEERYRSLVAAAGLRPLPGAADWVARLGQLGWRQAIASSAPRANVEAVMRQLEFSGAFGALVAAEDVTAGKPDPQVFLVAASRLGVPPPRCIVVEDAPAGIEAARRAGMRSVGVGGASLGADIHARSLVELPPDAFDRLL